MEINFVSISICLTGRDLNHEMQSLLNKPIRILPSIKIDKWITIVYPREFHVWLGTLPIDIVWEMLDFMIRLTENMQTWSKSIGNSEILGEN